MEHTDSISGIARGHPVSINSRKAPRQQGFLPACHLLAFLVTSVEHRALQESPTMTSPKVSMRFWGIWEMFQKPSAYLIRISPGRLTCGLGELR